GQADAHTQVQRVFAGDGIVHQVLELRLVGGLAVDERLAGASDDGLFDKALFIKAITQAFGAVVRVVAETGQRNPSS
ncbi:hypothetical protein QN382_23045, partial [Pseudomonas sp. 10B1]|uniref:hypothetical protein n=1 Tax=unclassified Pseudomonas TaxID=196821 RepID=UPI002B23B24C